MLDKKTIRTLGVIIGLMCIVAVILIVCMTIDGRNKNIDNTEVTTSESKSDESLDVASTESSETASEDANKSESTNGAQMDYAKDIVEKANNAESLVSMNGKDYTIPCQFSSMRNDFEYREILPDTLPAGGYLELHVLVDKIDSGVMIILLNTTDSEISIDDSYVGYFSIEKDSEVMEASCLNLTYGSEMADIKTMIEFGNYEYETSTYDYKQTFRVSISDNIGALIVYDMDEQIVTRVSLQYIII